MDKYGFVGVDLGEVLLERIKGMLWSSTVADFSIETQTGSIPTEKASVSLAAVLAARSCRALPLLPLTLPVLPDSL